MCMPIHGAVGDPSIGGQLTALYTVAFAIPGHPMQTAQEYFYALLITLVGFSWIIILSAVSLLLASGIHSWAKDTRVS